MSGKRRSYRPWTTVEAAYVRKHYPTKGGAAVAAELGRAYQSVNQYASRLGLKRQYVDMAGWSLDDIRAHCTADDEEPESGCWLWRGYVNTNGHPYLYQAGRLVAARLKVFQLWRPHVAIKPGNCLAMTCDERTCLNPKHMRQMNKADVMRRHSNEALRVAKIAATHRKAGKLDPEKVSLIRASDKCAEEMAVELGVSASVVYRVRSGRAWADNAVSALLAA